MLFQKLRRRRDPGTLNALSIAGTIGLHLASGVIVGSVIGYLLDKWLETAPWCFMAFMVVGIIAGFKNVYVDTKRLLDLQYGPSAQARGTALAGKTPTTKEGHTAPAGKAPLAKEREHTGLAGETPIVKEQGRMVSRETPAAEGQGHGKDAPSGPQPSPEARQEEQEQA